DRLGYAAKATAYPRAPSAQRDYRENRYPANRLRDEFHAQPPVLSDRLPVDRCGLLFSPPLSRFAGSQKKPQKRLRWWRCRARCGSRVLVARSCDALPNLDSLPCRSTQEQRPIRSATPAQAQQHLAARPVPAQEFISSTSRITSVELLDESRVLKCSHSNVVGKVDHRIQLVLTHGSLDDS